MEQWRIDYNAAMGATNAALSAGNYNAAIDYANKAASLGNTSAAATAAVNLRQQIYSKAGSGYGPGATMGAGDPAPSGGGPAPTGSTQQTTNNEPPQWYKDYLASIERKRQSAFDDMLATLKGYGIDFDGSFSSMIKGWVWDDKSPDWMMMEIRKSDPYNRRFTGMADLIKRGQFMDEATYIAQERAYRAVMKQFDLPEGFYDGPEDFGRFIANGVSVKEVSDRITTAKTFLDETTDPAYKRELAELYGITEGGMLAYVLDGDKAQASLQRQLKATQIAGSSSKYGYNLSAAEAEKYGATLGAQYDAFGAEARGQLESAMGQIDQMADQDERLSAIENDAYDRRDALDASLLNDTGKQMASQKRASRERARFSGSSGFTTGSLAR